MPKFFSAYCIKSLCCFSISLLALCVFVQDVNAQSLSSVRSAVREPDDSKKKKKSKSHGHSHHHDNEDSIVGDIIGGMLGCIFKGVFSGISHDDGYVGPYVWWPAIPPPYPSCSHSFLDSYYLYEGEPIPENTTCECLTRRWFGNVSLEYGNDYDQLERMSGQLRLTHVTSWGIDTTWSSYQENFATGGQDQLWIGDVNLTYQIASRNNFISRVGLGINWLDDSIGTEAGINVTYGADIFFDSPFVISSEIDWGTLGEAERFHARATVGVVLDRVEAFSGFDYESFDGRPLKSVVFGVRLWY